MSDLFGFNSGEVDRIARAVRAIENSRPKNNGGGKANNFRQIPDNHIDVLIQGSNQDGSNYRWKYSWAQAQYGGGGYSGGWTLVASGQTGTSNLYNAIENINGSSGAFGNGTNSSDFTGTGFELQPIPNNTPIRIYPYFYVDGDGNGQADYWCWYENGVSGGCSDGDD